MTAGAGADTHVWLPEITCNATAQTLPIHSALVNINMRTYHAVQFIPSYAVEMLRARFLCCWHHSKIPGTIGIDYRTLHLTFFVLADAQGTRAVMSDPAVQQCQQPATARPWVH